MRISKKVLEKVAEWCGWKSLAWQCMAWRFVTPRWISVKSNNDFLALLKAKLRRRGYEWVCSFDRVDCETLAFTFSIRRDGETWAEEESTSELSAILSAIAQLQGESQ